MNKQNGFTLIEVLVAIAVIALSVSSAMVLMMKQADTVSGLRTRAIALWVADNTNTRLQLVRQISGEYEQSALTETVTMAGGQWQVVSEPEETQSGTLLRYRTRVSPVGAQQSVTTLDTYIH